MSLSKAVMDAVEWSDVEVLRGTGADLATSLGRFLQAEEPDEVAGLWWGLEGVVFAQNTIYGSAVPTVDVVMAALADEPAEFLRPWIMEVLRFILTGASDTDPSLQRRCRETAKTGTWLLAAEARQAKSLDYREAVLEILALVHPRAAMAVEAAG